MNKTLTQTEQEKIILLYKEDFANFFKISYNGSKYVFNINKNIYFDNIDNLSISYYHNYEVKERDTWTTISYSQYNTIELWWLICRVNHIYNPTVKPQTGQVLKILSQEVVDNLTASIGKNGTSTI